MRNGEAASGRADRSLGSVANALRLIEVLARSPHVGVSELARALDLSKASIDRLLTTLTRAGFAEQDPHTRRYRLTVKIVALADGVRSRIGVVEVARPHLAALADQVREGVNLGILREDALVYLETIPSTHTFKIEARPGVTLPAYCTGAGKALLAFSRPPAIEAYLARLAPVAHTPNTLTSTALLRDELTAIQREGFAEDRGELLEEAWCVAAPVLDADGFAVAAVSITAPRSRYAAKRAELASAVTATTRHISAGIAAAGVTPAPPRPGHG